MNNSKWLILFAFIFIVEVLATANSMHKRYPGIFRIWFGPVLVYIVTAPKYFEQVLYKHLEKGFLYESVRDIFGTGLLSNKGEFMKHLFIQLFLSWHYC